jgi:hypothetical protein
VWAEERDEMADTMHLASRGSGQSVSGFCSNASFRADCSVAARWRGSLRSFSIDQSICCLSDCVIEGSWMMRHRLTMVLGRLTWRKWLRDTATGPLSAALEQNLSRVEEHVGVDADVNVVAD